MPLAMPFQALPAGFHLLSSKKHARRSGGIVGQCGKQAGIAAVNRDQGRSGEPKDHEPQRESLAIAFRDWSHPILAQLQLQGEEVLDGPDGGAADDDAGRGDQHPVEQAQIHEQGEHAADGLGGWRGMHLLALLAVEQQSWLHRPGEWQC